MGNNKRHLELRVTVVFIGQIENSETSEIFFRLFDFDPTSKIENSVEEKSEKNFRDFRAFRVFNLPLFRFFNQVSQI